MLISWNWLRDFTSIPEDVTPGAFAERFTLVCAEVETVERIDVAANGLIAAKIVAHQRIAPRLARVTLDIGGSTIETVSAAADIRDGALVIYAPPGASTRSTGRIESATVAGVPSTGMILSGDSLGIALAADDAIYCPPTMHAGDPIDGSVFDDWVIEVDNKSITHRPDLWGHYGIARETAAIYATRLKPYPVADADELSGGQLPEIPIDIQQPQRCPRYSGLMLTGVGGQSSPLWMQARLGHVGMRPIDALVDLTNYIMAELGQPMHAFDGDKVRRIEVGFVESGQTFTTLDGVARRLPPESLMILSSGQPVAVAGVMGGSQSEVSPDTRTLLLESANFEPAGIRRTATALGLRTEASARFEKSLDPAYTTLAIQRFVELARGQFPDFAPASRLSDRYPKPPPAVRVEIDPRFVDRYIGAHVPPERIEAILTAIGFGVQPQDDKWVVTVPSYRATKDISIEADVIEEVARYVGYDNIVPAMPRMSLRYFTPNKEHRLERDTLQTLCTGLGYTELHRYIWFDTAWCRRLGVTSIDTVRLRNPVAAGQEHLRDTLMPGLLEVVNRNRLHADRFKICEVGSVFPAGAPECRRLALICAARGKRAEDELVAALKGDLETWAWQVLGVPINYAVDDRSGRPPWAHENKTARIEVSANAVGRVSSVPPAVRRQMDEHLAAWSVAWAEVDLDPVQAVEPTDIHLRRVPDYPQVELDFSLLVPAVMRFGQVNEKLTGFDHDLLRRLSFVGAYQGDAIDAGKRSLTYRARLGASDRTLIDQDVASFREAFERHVRACGFELRA